MTGKLFRRSGDAITDRVIAALDDFGGWADDAPTIRTSTATHDDEPFWPAVSPPVRRRETTSSARPGSGGTPAAVADSSPVCPSCGCTLPDPDHLVSNSILLELSRARDTRSSPVQQGALL